MASFAAVLGLRNISNLIYSFTKLLLTQNLFRFCSDCIPTCSAESFSKFHSFNATNSIVGNRNIYQLRRENILKIPKEKSQNASFEKTAVELFNLHI